MAERKRTISAIHIIRLRRGPTRDYEQLGTGGHVDKAAAIPSPNTLLLHEQQNPEHLDCSVSRELRAFLETTRHVTGREGES